ncbi:hypothetical protein AAC387_Pa09g0380 [Persea americana]
MHGEACGALCWADGRGMICNEDEHVTVFFLGKRIWCGTHLINSQQCSSYADDDLFFFLLSPLFPVTPMTMLPKAWQPTMPATTSNSVQGCSSLRCGCRSTAALPSVMSCGSALSDDD